MHRPLITKYYLSCPMLQMLAHITCGCLSSARYAQQRVRCGHAPGAFALSVTTRYSCNAYNALVLVVVMMVAPEQEVLVVMMVVAPEQEVLVVVVVVMMVVAPGQEVLLVVVVVAAAVALQLEAVRPSNPVLPPRRRP
jgi:hypothetical protein